MRIIPKKIKVKNTVWKCYSMADVIVALIVFAIIFVAITSGAFAFAVIMGLLAVVMFMPTQDGIFYSCILENIKFLFAKKVYTENADKQKARVLGSSLCAQRGAAVLGAIVDEDGLEVGQSLRPQ